MNKPRVCRAALLCLLAAGLLLTGCTVKRTASQWQEHYDQGMAYLRDGYYDEALTSLNAALEADPNRAEIYVGRGMAYLSYPGDGWDYVDEAQADFEQALSLDPSNPEAWICLADVYLIREDTEGAVNILKEALDHTAMDEDILQRINDLESLLDPGLGSEEAFSAFLEGKGYLEYLEGWCYGEPAQYAMAELNWDGRDELVLTGPGDMGFYNFAVFAYDQESGQVVPARLEENVLEEDYVGQYYGSLQYSAENRALVYRELNNGRMFDVILYAGLESPSSLTTLFVLTLETDGQSGETSYRKYVGGETHTMTAEAFEDSVEEAVPLDLAPLPQ